MDMERVREAARSAARELGYTDLKQEQLRVVEAFVEGRDVFAVLPTGYGKSLSALCYACLPIVFTKLLATEGGGARANSSHCSSRQSVSLFIMHYVIT